MKGHGENRPKSNPHQHIFSRFGLGTVETDRSQRSKNIAWNKSKYIFHCLQIHSGFKCRY